jgi:hypothetical protein
VNRANCVACCLTIAICAGLIGVTNALSQPKDDPEKKGNMGMGGPAMEEMKKMQERMMKVMMPGEHHKELEKFAGSWKTTLKMWMMGPAGPATTSSGTAEVRKVLDGRFMLEEYNGEMKMPGPDGKMQTMPFKGIGMMGYDNYKNMYVGSWADSMGTQLLNFMGTSPPGSKTITCYGQMDEPMMNVSGRMVKYETKIISDDKRVFTMYDLHAGPDYKVVEVTYERK